MPIAPLPGDQDPTTTPDDRMEKGDKMTCVSDGAAESADTLPTSTDVAVSPTMNRRSDRRPFRLPDPCAAEMSNQTDQTSSRNACATQRPAGSTRGALEAEASVRTSTKKASRNTAFSDRAPSEHKPQTSWLPPRCSRGLLPLIRGGLRNGAQGVPATYLPNGSRTDSYQQTTRWEGRASWPPAR